ncbi:MAG: xylose isomerase, partial [Pseudomonas sp.]|nr:xylose isomerase [Pseudomonas sp.]
PSRAVGEGDILGNAAQIDTLLSGGYSGYLSFEPFADSVHGLANIEQAIGASMNHLNKSQA